MFQFELLLYYREINSFSEVFIRNRFIWKFLGTGTDSDAFDDLNIILNRSAHFINVDFVYVS